MNLASAGPLVASCVECFARQPGNQSTAFASKIAGYAALALLIGAALGGVMLLFFWNASYEDLLMRRLRSRSFFGLLEVAFSLVLHLIYWRWAAAQVNSPRPSRYWRALFAVVTSANLLYHFPTLFAIVAQVASESTPASEEIGRKQMYVFLASGPILSHAFHFVMASIAVSGVFGALLLTRKSLGGSTSSIRRMCVGLALVSTVLQIPVGIAVYLTLPGGAQRAMMGDNLFLSIAFLGSLGCALWLIQSLTHLLPDDATASATYRAALSLFLTILLMSGVLWGTRGNRITPKAQRTVPPSAIDGRIVVL